MLCRLAEQLLGFAPELALQAHGSRQVAQAGVARLGLLGGFNARQPGVIYGIQSHFQGLHQAQGLGIGQLVVLHAFPHGQEPLARHSALAVELEQALGCVQRQFWHGAFRGIQGLPYLLQG